MMKPVSFARYRFPADIIRQAGWLYFRFTLSFRDVEDLMAQRGIEVSYETIRMWTQKFGRLFAHNLRKSRPAPSARWHLDEMVVRIRGERMFLWRAVDDEGEVLDMLVQKRRNKAAALRLLRKLLKNQGVHPETIVTDGSGVIPRCGQGTRVQRPPSGRAAARQQSSRELSSLDSPPGTQTAAIQIARFSPEISRHSCRRLQHLQRPAPSDQPPHTPSSEGQCNDNLDGSHGFRLTIDAARAVSV